MMSPFEVHELLEANEKPRPVVIRTNTLKTRRNDLIKALTSRGVSLQPVEWSKVALQVFSSSVPVGSCVVSLKNRKNITNHMLPQVLPLSIWLDTTCYKVLPL